MGGRSGAPPTVLLATLAIALMVVAFVAGYVLARADTFAGLPIAGHQRGPDGAGRTATGTPVAGGPDSRPPADIGRQLDSFWEAWNFVEESHYRQPVDRDQLVRGAIEGMMAALNDRQASYLSPLANREEKANLDGIIEGIGASVDLKARRHTIVAPIEDGPAARAGLRSGDVILKVDGRDVADRSVAEVAGYLRGPAGTKVRLVIVRADDPAGQPVELEITRARLEIEAVTFRMLADGIGYMRIRIFGSQTVPQVSRALREMRSRRARGLILDLRDNPGGYLSSSIEVANQFIKDGRILFYEEHLGVRRMTAGRGGGLATDLTLAVLVNRGTASAAEIVAGAIRDHERGILIGEPTFGKGTVQQTRDLSDGSAVRVTTSTWLTPSGKSVEGHGLQPDVMAKPGPEDERTKRDVALERALEWFKVPLTNVTPVPGQVIGPSAEPGDQASESGTAAAGGAPE